MTPPAANHNAVLKATAHNALAPLGLTQVGRSRTWLDDRGWCLIVVEFQPSSGRAGSYLNVGANWLWQAKDHLSIDYGDRVGQFRATGADWRAAATELCDLAVKRVVELREETRDMRVLGRLLAHEPGPWWPRFHAAVAAGLAGDRSAARVVMDAILSEKAEYPWQRELLMEAAEYRDLLDQDRAFRARVLEEIGHARARLHLPQVELALLLTEA